MGIRAGLSFKTISFRPAEYLPWLMDQLSKRGVSFVHKHVSSIEEAAYIGGKECTIINATGLGKWSFHPCNVEARMTHFTGAKSLLGVEDKEVYPIRGQTIIVEAPDVRTHMSSTSSLCRKNATDDLYLHPGISTTPGSEPTYIIPRPDGTAIMGGSYQADRYDLLVDNDLAARIHERCSKLEPRLKDAKILSLNVGLRPSRHGGARVEKEVVHLPLKRSLVPYYGVSFNERAEGDLTVIHAYGLGCVDTLRKECSTDHWVAGRLGTSLHGVSLGM